MFFQHNYIINVLESADMPKHSNKPPSCRLKAPGVSDHVEKQEFHLISTLRTLVPLHVKLKRVIFAAYTSNFFILRKPAVLEKYFAPPSLTLLSAAWGLIISSPFKYKKKKKIITPHGYITNYLLVTNHYHLTWDGVNATLEAVPDTCFLTDVLPPQTCCFCKFFCRVFDIRTLVFSSTWAVLIRPVPALPIVPRVYPKSSW